MELSPLQSRVQALEDEMLLMTEHQISIETVHHFAPGLYARSIRIPKGCVLTGKIHLHGHLNFVLQGEISVMTDEGIKRITAPAIIKSDPGIKRVGYAHEETVWTTVHACAETEIEAAERALVVETFEQYALQSGEEACRLLQ